MSWTVILLLILLFIFIVVSWSCRKRQKNEPPLDKGFIPWLGHALEFGKDAAKFLARMKEKHGDIFTVRVAGHYVTVLLDPNSFDSVVNDTEYLDFTRIRGQLLKRIFSLQMAKPASERTWMKGHFHGAGLFKLNTLMSAHLQNLMLSNQNGSGSTEWREDGLFNLCYRLLFRAGYLTLFERRDNVVAVYNEFRKFDDLLTKLARCSLKCEEKKTVKSSQERLWELLSSSWRNEESDSWHQRYRRFLQDEGTDADMQNRASLLQLWTTQCNAGPAAFWLLGFLLTHPEAMEAVKSEIRGLSALQDSSLQHPTISLLEAHSTPVFDSVLSETLRLTAAVMINREVVQDKILRMADGQEYHLRRGDRVCLFPFLSPQMDPQIHQQPQISARNSCVGKEFAVTAIKQFVFLLLTHLDLEMCDPEAKLPPVNSCRYGFGMLQPDGDLQVRYRLKRTQHEM